MAERVNGNKEALTAEYEDLKAGICKHLRELAHQFGEKYPDFTDSSVHFVPRKDGIDIQVPSKLFPRIWFQRQRQVEHIQTFFHNVSPCQVSYHEETIIFSVGSRH